MSTDIEQIQAPRNWDGWLTVENAEAVAARIRKMLAGRYFTLMSESEEGEARLKVSCQLAGTLYTDGRAFQETGVSVSRDSSFASVDIYIPGTGWPFLNTHIPSHEALTGGHMPDRTDCFMSFEEKRFGWRCKNAMGDWRRWTIAVEEGRPAPEEEN